MSSPSPKLNNSSFNDEEAQQQHEPLMPPPRAARTYYIPITSASVEMRQDWLERLNLFFTLSGAAFVIVGACAIVLPLIFSITVQTLTCWILVAGGAVALLNFLLVFGAPSTTSFLLLAVLHLGVGIWMLVVSGLRQTSPFIYITVGWFALHGIIKLLMACQLRNLTSWPALMVSGVVSILLAAVNFVFTTSYGVTFFTIIFGADLAFTGFAFFLISFMACLATRAASTQEPLLEEATSYHAAQAHSP